MPNPTKILPHATTRSVDSAPAAEEEEEEAGTRTKGQMSRKKEGSTGSAEDEVGGGEEEAVETATDARLRSEAEEEAVVVGAGPRGTVIGHSTCTTDFLGRDFFIMRCVFLWYSSSIEVLASASKWRRARLCGTAGTSRLMSWNSGLEAAPHGSAPLIEAATEEEEEEEAAFESADDLLLEAEVEAEVEAGAKRRVSTAEGSRSSTLNS